MATTLEMRAILKDEISAGLKGIEAELKKVASEGKAAGAGMSSGMSSALPSVRSVTDALGAQTAQLRAQAAAMKSAEYQKYAAEQKQIRAEIEAMTAPQKKAESGWMSMVTAVKGFMALQVVGYIKDATVAVFNATAEMQSLSMGLTAVMGSSADAAKELETLKEVAKLPGLGYAEAIRMSTSLQASGMSARMARDAMMGFGNALATVGKGKAELDGVGVALSQIMAKGKVSAEEINQIAERVPQIRVAMEAAFGTANTEVIQAMGLSSREFIAGVTAELGKLKKVTGGLGNESENLSDAWFQLKANIGGAGTVFADSLRLVNSVLGSINRGYDEMRKASEKHKIDTALKTMAWIRKVEAEEIASGRKLTAAEKAEIEKRLNQQRKILSEFAPKMTKPEIDAKVELAKSLASVKRKTAADEISMELQVYTRRKEIAKGDTALLEQVELAHQQRLEEIKKKFEVKGKKTKKEKTKEASVDLTDPEELRQRRAQNEQDMADLRRNRKKSDDLIELARKGTEDRLKNESDVAKEARKRREEEKAEFEADLASRLSMHNGTLTSMLKGETDFSDGMRTMWDETGTAVINKILEMGAAWIAEQAAMLVFGTTVKAAEVGTSVAAGTAMTAAYAPAATAASIASFGGAAAAGSASMAATIPAMMAMFSYADRGGSTLVGQNRLMVGETRPEEFRKTVPGNIHNTTTNMGGVTIHVSSPNPGAAGRDIQRVLRDASINNRGGSH